MKPSKLLLLAIVLSFSWLDGGFAKSSFGAERENLDQFEKSLIAYHDDGTYGRELQEVAARVIARLREQAPKVLKPALVLDVDETSLSNWPKLRANGFAFFAAGPCDHLPDGPCGEDTWEKLGVDAAIEPTLQVYRTARELGVAVFFVTGRKEAFRSATEHNLRYAGYAEWVDVVMEADGSQYLSAADFKSPARDAVEGKGYTIIANVGDQHSDLRDFHDVRDLNGEDPKKTFKVPNPFYFIR